MKILCAPKTYDFSSMDSEIDIVLYAQATRAGQGSIGAAIVSQMRRVRAAPPPRAWDFLSIALSCYAADLAGHRKRSPDGWTRQFEVSIAVNDPEFWISVKEDLQSTLNFLTTDIWEFNFLDGGFLPAPIKDAKLLNGDCVALVSGGLDSFIGLVDLYALGFRPLTVSQISRGDRQKQIELPASIGADLNSLLLTHGANIPGGESPASQRSRSIVFIAYAVLIAPCLEGRISGSRTKCFLSENGFISLNPPLTPMRVGSLSTRTTHPTYLNRLKRIFNLAGFELDFQNNYSLLTKGEMLESCRDQNIIRKLAHTTTSCGRFLHYNYKHCGRCVPCLVRRSAFLRWGISDNTDYIYSELGRKDDEHAGFDDVRAAAMACLEESEIGTLRWAGATLASAGISDTREHLDMLHRGLDEIRSLLTTSKVI